MTAQDTVEHITDFGSAGDHVRTLQKWQEMGVPMMMKRARPGSTGAALPVSAFDEGVDNTQIGDGGAGNVRQRGRWKYAGPWIAGMQDGEFGEYLERSIVKRKDEWRRFLSDIIVEGKLAKARQQARHDGALFTRERQEELRRTSTPDSDELKETEKTLRDNHALEGLSSELTALLCDFLDLPGVRPTSDEAASTPMSATTASLNRALNKFDSDETAAEASPLTTHPSAGLSHIRTNAFLSNHPLWGPQAQPSPVLARVVETRNGGQRNTAQAKLGVAGTIAFDPLGNTYSAPAAARRHLQGMDPDRMVDVLDEEMEGGNKMWVHPQSAWMDEKARIRLSITRGNEEAVAVRNGEVRQIHEARMAAQSGTQAYAASGAGLGGVRRAGERGGARGVDYERGMSDRRASPSPSSSQAWSQRRAPEVEGFDGMLGRTREQGEMDGTSAARRIRDLFEQGRGR